MNFVLFVSSKISGIWNHFTSSGLYFVNILLSLVFHLVLCWSGSTWLYIEANTLVHLLLLWFHSLVAYKLLSLIWRLFRQLRTFYTILWLQIEKIKAICFYWVWNRSNTAVCWSIPKRSLHIYIFMAGHFLVIYMHFFVPIIFHIHIIIIPDWKDKDYMHVLGMR